MSLPSAKKRKIFDSRYEVISIVGRGADSVVYHAKHLSGGDQEVALKVLIGNKQKNSMTERLRKEALTLVSCRHKYVVRLDDFHSVADLCYLSMEYAPLGDLRKYINNLGTPLSPELGAEFLRQSLEGMEFIHATGVLHRDLKPDNILVINDKEIRLADFGLALLPGDEIDLEELQNGVGSLSYLPPEMLDGKFYDSRSDLYALGVCFYEAMAGFHPFDQAPLSEQNTVRLDQNIKPLHEVNPLIPKHASAVIARLMKYSADERFQTAMGALRALLNPELLENSPAQAAKSDTGYDDLFDIEDRTSFLTSEENDSLTPANLDEPETKFTDNFEDFFRGTDYSSAPKNTAQDLSSGDTAALSATSDTEELSAQRVQQLIAQDEKNRTAVTARGKTSAVASNPNSTNSVISARDEQETSADEDFQTTPHNKHIKQEKVGILASLLRMHPVVRTLTVGGCAAVVTVAIVLLSNVQPPKHLTDGETSSETEHYSEQEEVLEVPGNSLFPHMPSGLYAGNIKGLLPGVTSPLALISRPEHNSLTVVLGIEGWTPTTVSSDVEDEDSSSTIVIRSNGMLLNMTGTLSSDEVSGTFSNAITGETGVWSARKVS